MALIDERGYLFGRVNPIDAALVFVLLWCIPLGYGAYRLFRTPMPEIVSLTGPTLVTGTEMTLKLEGRNLRPFLRASAGATEARLLVESPTRADVVIPAGTPPGTYDLIIYDLAQELTRRKDAIVVTAPVVAAPPAPPSTTVDVEVLGAFTGLSAAAAKKLRVSQQLGQTGQAGSAVIVRLDGPKPEMMRLKGIALEGHPKPDVFRVPALLQLRCAFVAGDCSLDGRVLGPEGTVLLAGDGAALRFEITDVYPRWAYPATVNVRGVFVGLDHGEAQRLAGTPAGDSRNRASWGELLSVSPPSSEVVMLRGGSGQVSGTTGRYRVAAVAAIRCSVTGNECRTGSVLLAPGVVIPMLTAAGVLNFQVGELFPGGTTHVNVTMVCATDSKILSLVEEDLKSAGQASLRGMAPALVAVRDVTPNAKLATGGGGFTFERTGTVFSVVVRVPAEETAAGWQSGTTILRAGERFTYTQPAYVLNGLITAVEPAGRPAAR
jgi:hypothetical protein